MALRCNIDAKGKRVRLINGLVALAAGAVLVGFWARGSESVWPWIVSIVVLLAGAFMIFEARAGWCAIRAMGLKTSI